MELDELKKVWNSFDMRLQQQDMLKKVILKESLVNKSDKGLGRMINYGYFGLILTVCGLFVVIWAAFQFPNRPLPMRISLYLTIACALYALIISITGLSKLLKIDLSAAIKESMQKITAYRKWYHKQLIIMLVSAGILVISILITYFFFIKIQAWQWIYLFGCLGIAAVGSWWEYKRMFQKNMDTIQKSLEELKELEEE